MFLNNKRNPELDTFDLTYRLRRRRKTPAMRDLVREVRLHPSQLVLPIFVEEGISAPVAISTLPGVVRYPEAALPQVVREAWAAGIKAVLLFGVSHHKDAEGSDSWAEKGLVARIVSAAKEAAPEMVVIPDTCFCAYTTHGHCGVLVNDHVDNDLTLQNLQKQAVTAAEAGADLIAPSGMMDGMVTAIRDALDDAGFTDVGILSYASKFASCLYGPFREASNVKLKGDRKTYQLDPANAREAVAEALLDAEEGADMLMVKPGLAYLDILAHLRRETLLPLAVYQVSGEFAMIKLAAAAGAVDEKAAILETLTAFRRAGADLIITYAALDVARWLIEESN